MAEATTVVATEEGTVGPRVVATVTKGVVTEVGTATMISAAAMVSNHLVMAP